ncbi:MAG: FecR domain-containing protein [Leptospiraceae bacterium]|nr:FecR domain-containing protein [Leptospiraceae bacterium]
MRLKLSICLVSTLYLLISCASVDEKKKEDSSKVPEEFKLSKQSKRFRETAPPKDKDTTKSESKSNEKPIGKVKFLNGKVSVVSSDEKVKSLSKDDPIMNNDLIVTGESSSCEIVLNDGTDSTIRLRQKTKFKFGTSTEEKRGVPFLDSGSATFNLKKSKPNEIIKVSAPSWTAGVRGTTFDVNQTEEKFSLSVAEGNVAVTPYLPEVKGVSEDDSKINQLFQSKALKVDTAKKIETDEKESEEFYEKSGLNSILSEKDEEKMSKKLNDLASDSNFLSSFQSYSEKNEKKLVSATPAPTEKKEPESKEESKSSNGELPLVEATLGCPNIEAPSKLKESCGENFITFSSKENDKETTVKYIVKSKDYYVSKVNPKGYTLKNCSNAFAPKDKEDEKNKNDLYIAKDLQAQFQTCKETKK